MDIDAGASRKTVDGDAPSTQIVTLDKVGRERTQSHSCGFEGVVHRLNVAPINFQAFVFFETKGKLSVTRRAFIETLKGLSSFSYQTPKSQFCTLSLLSQS